jgi:uncharacterized membrane protein YczE
MHFDMVKRWSFLLVGLTCFGAGVAFMVRANLGLGPWDVLHQGIARHTHIAIGTVSIAIGMLVMLTWLVLSERPGVGTVLNILVIGVVTNVVLGWLPGIESLALQIAMMLGGILMVGFGSGMYLSSAMGAGPRDGLMLGLAARTGWSIRSIRTLIEITVLVFGVLLGGTFGVGTLAFAFGIGPVVQVSLRLFQRPSAQHRNTIIQSHAPSSGTQG